MRDKQSGVYIITNTVNGNRYIGSSVDIHRRWYTHKRGLRRGTHCNPILQNAWNKYGESAFEFSILLLCTKDDTLLNEQHCLDDMKPEYNICTCTTATMLGRVVSEETRRKIGDANRGNVFSEETRKRMSDAQRGMVWTDERRLKHGIAGKGKHTWTADDYKKHEGKMPSNTGRFWTDEAKRKLSESMKGNTGFMLGKHHTDEAKRKMSEAHKGKPSGRLGKKHTEETKLKMRESWARRHDGSE